MAVYVDNMRAAYGRMTMCHMIADSTSELLGMADKIGVARRWLQDSGTHREHFDICLSKRAAAIRSGAIAISLHDLSIKLYMRRLAPPKETEP